MKGLAMVCAKTGRPINPRTRPNWIPASELEWSARVTGAYGRFLGFDSSLCRVWTYAPCETTGQAIFGS
jgi:hypothetical protein